MMYEGMAETEIDGRRLGCAEHHSSPRWQFASGRGHWTDLTTWGRADSQGLETQRRLSLTAGRDQFQFILVDAQAILGVSTRGGRVSGGRAAHW